MARYAVADLHGQLELFNQIMDFIQPDDIVYCLGDAGDRGAKSWETLKAAITHPQVVYIKGNHDEMLVDAVFRGSVEKQLLFYNGGRKTYDKLKYTETPINQYKYLSKIINAPKHIEFINNQSQKVSLSHAGFDPWEKDEASRDYTWNRDHIGNEWEFNGIKNDIDIMVHGHTPMVYIYADGYRIESEFQDENDKDLHAVWYCNHHKVCIDVGACYTNQTVLLNLDTWEEYHFIKEGK